MAAEIIPFDRPRTKLPDPDPSVPPPLVTARNESYTIFVGSKVQLVAWGVANADEFPIWPKRLNSDPGNMSVRAIRKALFEIHCYTAGICTQEHRAEIRQLGERILQAGKESASLPLCIIFEWHRSMIGTPGWDAGLWELADKSLKVFQRHAIELAIYETKDKGDAA